MMRRRGFEVAGLDLSRDAAAMAWRYHGVPAVVADLERSPFPTRQLRRHHDVHTCWSISTIPGCILLPPTVYYGPTADWVIFVPNAASLQFALLGRRWNGLDVPRHLFDYRDRDIEKMLDDGGFPGCAAQLLLAARQPPRVWPPASLQGSTRWRAVCAVCGRALRGDWRRIWRISHWWRLPSTHLPGWRRRSARAAL
ncbi:MAG: hypothetical protein WDO73_26180 [Ignavibacteriota bacterium]